MALGLKARVVRRPSLPLTAADEDVLRLVRDSRVYREALERLSGVDLAGESVSEAALLHALLAAGIAQVLEAAEDAGYALLAAAQVGEETVRRAEARRRVPVWALEE